VRPKLLIATRNEGKLNEYRALLREVPVELTSLVREAVELEVEEKGESFAENAIAKALAYAQASGLVTLADDSGLEVDILGGEPGVKSARYAGPEASDQERIRHLLRRLEGVPWEERTACFRCVIAVATPGGRLETAEGTCQGLIARSPRGQCGFGYDPVFYLPERASTMAELPPEEKNRISHRARAARKIATRLPTLMGLE